jgi:hypothetical protein
MPTETLTTDESRRLGEGLDSLQKGVEEMLVTIRAMIDDLGDEDEGAAFTLRDGFIAFHSDGSTTVRLELPVGPLGPDGDAQYNRLDDRLRELAESWHEGGSDKDNAGRDSA